MTVQDIQNALELWAPREISWERDNVGLQVGEPGEEVKGVLVALDFSDSIIEESLSRGTNLVITHHPVLFHPLRRVSSVDRTGRLVTAAVRHRLNVLSFHTNLDFTRNGVSFQLAARLGLAEIDFLVREYRPYKKIVVFVPETHLHGVMQAMAAAGAGSIGRYDSCSFSTHGTGTFRALDGAKPFVGTAGETEEVQEARLEMIAPGWRLPEVLAAMRRSHPYEEIAHDIYDLANAGADYGVGALGTLPAPAPLGTLLARVAEKLRSPFLRYTGDPDRSVRRVAVCGGGGSDLVPAALKAGADVLVTADAGYHRFEECDGRIALIDAGHYETEHPVLDEVCSYLTAELRGKGIPVFTASASTNPVRYYQP